VFEEMSPVPAGRDEDTSWSPPPTVATWRVGVPLESLRFAATNHLLVELDYDGSSRLIEPSALRMSRAGRLLLHAERADGSGHRAYGVDKITGLRVTTTPLRAALGTRVRAEPVRGEEAQLAVPGVCVVPAGAIHSSVRQFPSDVPHEGRRGAVLEDDFLGDRFWGQAQGFSGRLEALRGRGAAGTL
jgi:hypothetical protein